MTVAIVGTDMAPVHPGAGGIENLLWGWSNQLGQTRDVVVLSVPTENPSQSTGRVPIKTFTDGQQCRHILTSIDPDVVVTNNRPLLGEGFNQVALLHNRFPAWRNPAYDRWQGAADECASALRQASVVATVSQFLGREVSDLIGRPVGVLHPFAANAFFEAGRTGPESNDRISKDRVVRYVGRLLEKKGVGTVLALARRMPDIRFELTNFISPWTTPTEEHHRLRTEAGELANVAMIEPPESVPALARLMASSPVILVPSIWEEPFGLVAIEAQAAGTTVLVNNVGGLPETVAYSRSIVDFRLLDDIEQRVRQCLDAPYPTEDQGRLTASRFSLEASTRELVAMLDGAIAQPQATS